MRAHEKIKQMRVNYCSKILAVIKILREFIKILQNQNDNSSCQRSACISELILLFKLEFQSIFKYAVFGAVNNLVELGEI